MNELELGQATSTLQGLSQDAEARRVYEVRQKVLHDEASMLDWATQAGLRQGARIVAQNMLRFDLDLDTIVQVTGLSESKILALEK
ncbi:MULTISPECIES: hypothetical protein [Saccharibacillus]|uniref:hypothetical protein n=1 Tax=Saccharibacillus TaxID=456492 RepID=UPI001239607F|nr:hypothetical protein [Saccharibacillus sp. WB 17]MWJ30696.1 hypothetical protein [Saccharibacillus sp. WB 17]